MEIRKTYLIHLTQEGNDTNFIYRELLLFLSNQPIIVASGVADGNLTIASATQASLSLNISKSTHWDVVTVGPVAVSSIRKLSAVCDFSLGFDIFISSVTHGPSSII